MKTKIFVLRAIHGIIAICLIFFTFLLYYSAFTGFNGKLLYVGCILLIFEGIFVCLNNFECPLHKIYWRLGERKSFFGLFVPRQYLKYVMPISVFLGVVGFIILFLVRLIN